MFPSQMSNHDTATHCCGWGLNSNEQWLW
jgi:hypothetical protein